MTIYKDVDEQEEDRMQTRSRRQETDFITSCYVLFLWTLIIDLLTVTRYFMGKLTHD